MSAVSGPWRLIAAAFLSAGGIIFCGRSAAQTPVDALDEVVVSARKRTENAQDVPISLSVRDGQTLANANDFRVQEILRSMPNVTSEVLQPRQASIVIRGLGKNPANDGLETSVGIFQDGVYLGRPGMAVTDLIDIERMEVLRGPQGTLFGKNTTAGALNIVTRSPGNEFETWGQVSVGNQDFFQLSGALNAPLMADRLALRISAFDTQRKGFIHDVAIGQQLGEFDRRGARAQLLWTPGENTKIRFIGEYNSQDEDGPGYLLVDPGIIMADGSIRSNNFLDRSARASYVPLIDPGSRRSDADGRQRTTTDQGAFSAQADVHLGNHLLTSISAWRKWSFRPQNDGDYSGLVIQPEGGVSTRHQQISQELRLSSTGEGSFDYLLGAYFFAQELETTFDSLYGPDAADFMTAGLTPLALDGFHVITSADPETTSIAAFAQGTWRPTSRWEFTAGARWTGEKRNAHIERSSSGGAALPAGSTAAIAARARIGGFVAVDVDTDEDFVSGLLSARFEMTDEMMTYLSLARGAKSGGINVAILPAGADQSLDPEVANSVELGWKSQWLDDTLQLNLAAFWMDVDDYQSTQRDRLRNVYYLANAGTVRSRGVEFEGLYRPTAGLELTLAAGWNDATYTSFVGAPCPVETVNPTTCDFSGERVVGSPPWSATAAIRYEFAAGENLRVFTDAQYTHTAAFNIDLSDYTRMDAYGLANLQLGVQGRDDRWRAWVWAKNLTDAEYYTTLATAGAFSSGAVVGLIGDPRTYGLSFRARY